MTDQPVRPAHYGYSIWQFVLSLLAIGGLWLGALLIVVLGLLGGVSAAFAQSAAPVGQLGSLLLFAAGMFACGLLLIPSAVYSGKRMAGRPVLAAPRLPAFLRPTILILALPLVLLAGYWVVEKTDLSWLLLPPLHVLAIGLPVLWLVYLARRGLPGGSPQRLWGVLGSGLVLGPLLILILETIAFVVLGGVVILVISQQPDLISQLSDMSQQIFEGSISPQELVQALAPIINQPWAIFSAILFVALIVPLIEEAIKPIGVWLLVGFNLTPAAGFAAGALSGAGYAFFESLALASSTEEWTIMVTVRIATAVIHILNTALMGWALASAWQDKSYLRLALTYAGVVLFHGAWNALAVLNAVDSLLGEFGLQPDLTLVSWLGPVAPYLIGGMTVIAFAALLWVNFRLRQIRLPQPVLLETGGEPGPTA